MEPRRRPAVVSEVRQQLRVGLHRVGKRDGQAAWTGPNLGTGYSCNASAWIPDSHSNDPNAQYFVFTGSHYLANDANVNQENVTSNWVNVTNGTSFPLTNGSCALRSMSTTRRPAGWYEGGYAMLFVCSGN